MIRSRSPWLVAAAVLGMVAAPALAGPPDEPRVIEGHRDRQARRRAADADRPRARNAVLQHLRLRPPDRLRSRPEPRPRHPVQLRGRGRPDLHAPPAQGPQMVRRPALHCRGLPLLLGGCRHQRGSLVQRRRHSAPGRRRAAQGRGAGRAHRALVLVQAQPLLHSRARRRQSALHLPASPLPEAVPPEIRRSRTAEEADRRERCARLDPAVPAQGSAQRLRRSRHADAAALAPRHPAAGAALRRRAQSLLPPRRQQRPAAALHRQVHPRDRRRQADPDQDRRRRGRPAGPPPRVQGLHLPQGERAAQRAHHATLARGTRRSPGDLSRT